MKNLIAISVFAASTLLGQTTAIKGAYVFEESGLSQTGQSFHTLSSLVFDGQGQLQGTQYVKGIGSLARLDVRGNYSVDAAAGALVIERLVADPESETGLRFEAASYQLLKGASGTYQALRVDFGVLSEGTLTPQAAAAALRGEFAVSERGSSVFNQSYITLGTWVFDGQGNVTATLASRSFGVVASGVFAGRLAPQVDGSFDVTLTGPAVETLEGADATPPATLNYKLIPNGRGFELLRVDSGVLAETTVTAK